MNKTEAQRIAAVVNLLRPEWSTGLLMKVLGDDRMIRRPYADALIALTACAVDSTTKQPGRVHENGTWWAAVSAANPKGPQYRQARPGYCVICGEHWPLHGEPNQYGGHHYENPLDPRKSALPTDEQRAALEAARIEAEKKLTAAREAEVKREVRDPADVIANHATKENA
ncbi:hypothetical protein [Aeromicrobium sp. 9AM]|uniref:hypothetical protein n=1 Tax=Aeromicrobium sp. 9AM TaxID=2653126 RepID=UPI0012F01590|nr:hypothetical protein [Aeromicrobium sp. 9AM]VXC07640.1 hypothetical protein AERO9AM_30614 [Aeromicrobium sp. 9AM]